jgi:hypothetical protein
MPYMKTFIRSLLCGVIALALWSEVIQANGTAVLLMLSAVVLMAVL